MKDAEKTGLRPHGRSGLKYSAANLQLIEGRSPPTRAEWIEIFLLYHQVNNLLRLRPHGRSGLK